MTRYQTIKRALRDGMVFNPVAAPSLLEAGRGRMLSPGVPMAQWDAAVKRMTHPDPKGRVVIPEKNKAAEAA